MRNDDVVLRSVGVGVSQRAGRQRAEVKGVGRHVEVFQFHTFGKDDGVDLVACHVERAKLRAVVQVQFLQLVVGQIQCFHHVCILEGELRQFVVAEVEVMDGEVVVERHFSQIVVREVDGLQQVLLEGIVYAADVECSEVVARQGQFLQKIVPSEVNGFQTGARQREVGEIA